MATPKLYPASNNTHRKVNLKDEFECIGTEADNLRRIDEEAGAWKIIASAKYSISDFEDDSTTDGKEEFLYLSDEEMANVHDNNETHADEDVINIGNSKWERNSPSKLQIIVKTPSEPVSLTLSDKIQNLENLEKGENATELEKRLETTERSINDIQSKKGRRRSYACDSVENIEENNLKGIRCTSKKTKLPLSIGSKIEILKRLEKGETKSRLAKKYDVGRNTILSIEKSKDKILSYVNDSKEKRLEDNLKRTPLPPSKMVRLPLSTKVEILKRLEKGETRVRLAEKYDVDRTTISYIKKRKDKILSYVNDSIEKGLEDNLKRTSLPSKRISLPLSTKVEIIKRLEKGEQKIRIAESYGVSLGMIYDIERRKDNILTYVHDSIKKGLKDNLKRTSLPQSKMVRLPLSTKVEILKRLEKGETKSRMAESYGVSLATIYDIEKRKDKIAFPSSKKMLDLSKKLDILKRLEKGEYKDRIAEKYDVDRKTINNIEKRKDKILSYVNDSIEKGLEENLKRTSLPISKMVRLPLSTKVEILKRLEKGEQKLRIAEKYGVTSMSISSIEKQKDDILSYVKILKEKGLEENLKRTSLPKSKIVTLPLSTKVNILKRLEKGEEKIRIAERYGVTSATINNIEKRKDKILSFVHNSVEIEKDEEDNLELSVPPRSTAATGFVSENEETRETLKEAKVEEYGSSKRLRNDQDALTLDGDQIKSETTDSVEKSHNMEESEIGNRETPRKTFEFAKYSKLDIMDWHNNVTKEEYIDLSDEEEEALG